MANDGMGGARGRHAAGRALQAEGAVSAQTEACVCPERSRSRKEPQGQKQSVQGVCKGETGRTEVREVTGQIMEGPE